MGRKIRMSRWRKSLSIAVGLLIITIVGYFLFFAALVR